MTDRYDAFLIILDQDIRSDDAEATINAIKQIKGVQDVQPHVRDGMENAIAESRVKTALWQKIYAAFWKEEAV